MKSEDLIKKLEDTKPPDAELPGYKEQLKMALLEGAYPVRGKDRGITGLLKDAFTPKRKVWQTALAGTLTIALIASLGVVLPQFLREDSTALAKELALNDPEVQALIGNEELEEDDIEVLDSVDSTGYASVFIRVDADSYIVANVFMGIPGAEEVEAIETEMIPVTDAKKQEIIDIASTDPEIKALLDQGAFIYQYYFDYVPAYLASDSIEDLWKKVNTVKPLSVKDQEVICDELVEFTIRCWIQYEGMEYFFMIEMMGKTFIIDLYEMGPVHEIPVTTVP
jgi:hypothetical protein